MSKSGGAYGRRERLTSLELRLVPPSPGELMRYAAIAAKLARSKKLCAGYRLQHRRRGGGKGGEGLFVAEFLAVGKRGFPLFARGSFEVRSWLQKRCRCRGGLGGTLAALEQSDVWVVIFFQDLCKKHGAIRQCNGGAL